MRMFIVIIFVIFAIPAHAETSPKEQPAQKSAAWLKEVGEAHKLKHEREFNDFKPRAEAGDAQAQYKVGQAYLWGSGIEKDVLPAEEWLLKSANQGNAKAQLSLGMIYNGNIHTNKTIAVDHKKAIDWFLKSANQKEPEAYINLSMNYQAGRGLEKDEVEAFKWICLAMRNFRAKDTRNRPREKMNIDLFMQFFDVLTPDQIAEGLKRANEWQPLDEKR